MGQLQVYSTFQTSSYSEFRSTVEIILCSGYRAPEGGTFSKSRSSHSARVIAIGCSALGLEFEREMESNAEVT